MPEANSPLTDQSRSSRTLAKWNEIESLTSGLAVQALGDLARDSEQYMAEVKAMTFGKQQLRELIIKIGQEASQAATEQQTSAPLPELQTILEEVRSGLDSMNEMSEESSLRLQMMMDRRSKFISTLSNIMKMISATQDTLVQNLK
jgi:hypothetical protein